MLIDFILGERKYIQFEIKSSINQTVIITSATWKLLKDDEVVDSGDCEITEGNTLDVLLFPPGIGEFTLEVEYEIPPEVRKARCNINVY